MTRRLRSVATTALAVLSLGVRRQPHRPGRAHRHGPRSDREADSQRDRPGRQSGRVPAAGHVDQRRQGPLGDDRPRQRGVALHRGGAGLRRARTRPVVVRSSAGTPPLDVRAAARSWSDPWRARQEHPAAGRRRQCACAIRAASIRRSPRTRRSAPRTRSSRRSTFCWRDAYRRKAALERDPAAKRTLLQLAIGSYDELLKIDASNERARSELESVRADAASASGGRRAASHTTLRESHAESPAGQGPPLAGHAHHLPSSSSRWSPPPQAAGGTRASRRRIRARSC